MERVCKCDSFITEHCRSDSARATKHCGFQRSFWFIHFLLASHQGFIKVFDGHTTLKEQQKTSIRKLVDGQDVFAVRPTGFGKSLIYQILPALFSEIHRLRHGTIKNFVVAVVSPLEYIRVQQVETLRKLGIQAVCLDPAFDDETNDIKNESDSKVQVIYGSAEQWLANKF